MAQLTLDLPDDLTALVTHRAHLRHQSPETYIVSYLTGAFTESSEDKTVGQHTLEDILEERDKGPFIPLPRDWKEQVMAKARVHVATVRSSTASHV